MFHFSFFFVSFFCVPGMTCVYVFVEKTKKKNLREGSDPAAS